jgi:hypothetical protein
MSKEEETAMAMEDIKTDGIDSAWEGTSCQTIEEQDPSQVALSSSQEGGRLAAPRHRSGSGSRANRSLVRDPS